jgi:hypothetical protein
MSDDLRSRNVPQARHEHSAPVAAERLDLHLLTDHRAAVPERERDAYHEAAHGGWPGAVSYEPVNRTTDLLGRRV